MSIISSVPPDLRPRRRKVGIPDLTPAARRRVDANFRANQPKPPTDVQLAQQQIDPVVARIADAINARARSAADAVRGYTGSLAHEMQQTDFGSPYRQAIPQQAAVDAALQQSLAGKGNELAQGLSSRLAGLQEPNAVNPAAASVAGVGQASGNTELARGSAALSQLLSNQASAEGYGRKLPGIALLAGLQNLGRVQGQAVSDIASQTAPIYEKLPDIVAGIQTGRQRQQQLDFENRVAAKTLGLKTTSTNAAITHQQNADAAAQARVAISAANAALAQQKVSIANAQDRRDFEHKVAQGTKPNASLSNIYGFIVDSNGNPILNKAGKRIPVAKTKTAAAGNPFEPGGK